MKKTIKIDFKNFFESFDKEDNFITNYLRPSYEVVISDKPDYMFYSVYAETIPTRDIHKQGDMIKKISPALYLFLRKLYSKFRFRSELKKIGAPEGDFVKIYYAAEGEEPTTDECDWVIAAYPYEEINDIKYIEIPNHLINDFRFGDDLQLPFKREIDFEKIKKEKSKFCNFIYSQEIPFRNKFFKDLSKHKKIDSPGRCMTNMKPIAESNARDSRRSINWAEEKLEFLKPYKFTIAFENGLDNGFTTDKLVHPFLVNSIPIYMGNSKVDKRFNTESFINYHDFNNMDEFIEHIKKVDSDDKLWKHYLEQPIFKTKEQYYLSSKLRVINLLTQIIENGKK